MIRALCLAATLAVTAGSACAGSLYHQDFQKGLAPEWRASGEGDVRLSFYKDNVSLKFAGHGRSGVEVAARGFRDIVVRANIAALGLASGDGCYAEVSPDNGATWITALSVRRGQDDGVSRINGTFADPRLDDAAKLLFRFRADLSRSDAICWGDDVDVSGAAPVALRSGPLDVTLMTGAAPLGGLSPTSAFMPGPGAQAATGHFDGRLTIHPAKAPDGMAELGDSDPVTGSDPRKTWPDLTIDLVQDGGRIIPAQRGPIVSASPEWDWVIEPGQVWTDPADGGYSRVVLPVALEERNANCLHNGRLLLLLKPDGSASKAVVQFDADTCAYYKFDAWSLVPASYRAGSVASADAVIARDRAERASRPPLKPLDALTADHPGIDLAALARAAGPSAVFGIYDGTVHYAAPCHTRAGDDPLCAERSLPSYSTAKSLVAAQALFRLEALIPATVNEKVADHVPYCAGKGGWGDVRLIDLLDMASGHYDSAVTEADEDSPAMRAFFGSTTEAAKIAFACDKPRKSAPGKVWVYHTPDTFLLGVAMNDVVRKAGLGQDYYDSLIRPVWASLGQSPDLDDIRRTYDTAAQPFSGWGLTYHRDDVMRAARYLAGGAQIDGKSYLDPRLLNEALQRSSPGGGFVATGAHFRYRHGFWARDVGPLVGCSRPIWTPFMSGYGGISVVMFPDGVVYYAYNDDNHFDWAAAVSEIDKIKPLCS